jgi:hypothetical protein
MKQLGQATPGTFVRTDTGGARGFHPAAGLSSGRLQVLGLTMALFFFVEVEAALAGLDSTWDTRNYHLYVPFALLTGRWRTDLAAAHLQTFFAPTLDIPFYLLFRHISSTTVFNLVDAIPHALSACFAFLITLRLLHAEDAMMRLTAAVAVVIGVTGSVTLPVIATGASDMLGVALILGGLLVLVGLPRATTLGSATWPAEWRLATAAALGGTAVGLKLTFAAAAIGFAIAVGLLPGSLSVRFRRLGIAIAAGAAGALATGGWFWAFAWLSWGNPVFPFMNNVFHSPLVPAYDFSDHSFLPKSWLYAVLLPFLAGAGGRVQSAFHVHLSESYLNDPRFALALVSAAVILARAAVRPVARPIWFVVVFFVATFATWEAQSAIWRYLSVAR